MLLRQTRHDEEKRLHERGYPRHTRPAGGGEVGATLAAAFPTADRFSTDTINNITARDAGGARLSRARQSFPQGSFSNTASTAAPTVTSDFAPPTASFPVSMDTEPIRRTHHYSITVHQLRPLSPPLQRSSSTIQRPLLAQGSTWTWVARKNREAFAAWRPRPLHRADAGAATTTATQQQQRVTPELFGLLVILVPPRGLPLIYRWAPCGSDLYEVG